MCENRFVVYTLVN